MRKPIQKVEDVYDLMGIRKKYYPGNAGSIPIEVHEKTFSDFNIYEFRKFMQILEEEYEHRQEMAKAMEDMWNEMGERRKMMESVAV